MVCPWLYKVTAGLRPDYKTIGTTCKNDVTLKHIFAIEENPGFRSVYQEKHADRRIHVLSDMRKEWPKVFTQVKAAVA